MLMIIIMYFELYAWFPIMELNIEFVLFESLSIRFESRHRKIVRFILKVSTLASIYEIRFKVVFAPILKILTFI